jgi:uncharacterized protein
MHKIANEPLRTILFVFGVISMITGLAGIFLPILPGAPFIVIAAYFFSKSSRRFHDWLRNSRWFGQTVREWEDHQVIRKSTKIGVTMFVLVSLFYSLYFDVWIGVPAIIATAGVFLLIYVWTRNSTPPGS